VGHNGQDRLEALQKHCVAQIAFRIRKPLELLDNRGHGPATQFAQAPNDTARPHSTICAEDKYRLVRTIYIQTKPTISVKITLRI
jgi:hypothetical protein